MPKLDPDSDAFRAAGQTLVDWVADFLDGLDAYPVFPPVRPGEIEKRFAAAPSVEGKRYEELIDEFRQKILPGVTHWNHPAFLAYFAITGSQAGILGELLSAALNVNGMAWKTSPALTELELVTLRWLRDALGLPSDLFGIINDTASINSFYALAAAREKLDLGVRSEGMTGRQLPQLKIYCSEHAHSSIDKAALALGFGLKGLEKIPADDDHRMRADLLAAAVERDRAAGAVPCAIVATVGTTSAASVDPLRELGAIAVRHGIWLHVDAAYAGTAAIAPEFRWLWDGIESADSVVVSPHKWMFTPIDCSVLYLRDPRMLKAAFSLSEVPAYYLTLPETAEINFMDYGLQLGRRFRALKLWMVMEHYGIERIRATIRHHVALARRLAAELQKRDDIELLAPQSLSVVVFAKKSGDEETAALLERINASGRVFVSPTRLRGRYGIRVAIGNGATEWEHVARVLEFVSSRA